MTTGAPIYDAMLKYLAENNLRLHMPGHIGGRGFAIPELQMLAALDLTEVPGLDDLHAPEAAIAQARQRLALAYGAVQSYFLVNGATSGIHALFLSLPAETTVLVPRNAHRSFFGGMVISGARPVYIPVQVHPEQGSAMAVAGDDVKRLLGSNPEVDTVFVTSPSYYGTTCNIAEISRICQQNNKKLYVDEAHGGHFPFHPAYPRPALRGGADAVVNGLHKTLPVLNQGACLHLSDSVMNRDQIDKSCSLLTTTSPSYPILASIDLARQLMQDQGEQLLDGALLLAEACRKKINDIAGLHCYTEHEMCQTSGVEQLDPLKILVSVRELTIDGYETARILREQYNIQVEAEDTGSVLAMMSLFHRASDGEKFCYALQQIAAAYGGGKKTPESMEKPPEPEMILTPRQAFYANKQRVPLSQSAGMIAGEMVAAYPPGIPCLLPGELISREIYDYLCYLKNSPARLQGPSQADLKTLLVVNETEKTGQ